MLTRRPDIQAAEARLKQAVAEIGVAEAEFYPTFDLASQISIGSSMAGGGPHVPVLIAWRSSVLEQVIYDG